MQRQQSLYAFYRKGAKCKLSPAKKNEEEPCQLQRKSVPQQINLSEGCENEMQDKIKASEASSAGGSGEAKDTVASSDSNKRRKLMELGSAEELLQGPWAEVKSKFEWLSPNKTRDGNGRTCTDPLYDKRSIQIPADVLRKMSASQRQYWTTKSKYMDIVLFFKVGKFYELYELDAEIGHKELDWKMTVSGVGKCRQVGVPESGIDDAVQNLVARGYKVGRMEQTETSEQAKAKRGASATIERKLVQVLTPSTLVDGVLKPEATHLLALKESVDSDSSVDYGFTFVDAAAGCFYVGSFRDGSSRSSLEAFLTQIAPRELLYEVKGISQESWKVIRRHSGSAMLLTPLQNEAEFIEASATLKIIQSRSYFKESFHVAQNILVDSHGIWPDAFKNVEDKCIAATALGALLLHMQRIKMETELSCSSLYNYEVYKGFLRLDGHTMINLELLENTSNGTTNGTLIGYLDSCVTAFGKRLLRRWICHPLRNVSAINQRLDAVDELLARPEIASYLRTNFRKLPDLERLVARIRSYGCEENISFVLSRKAFQQRVKTLCSAVEGLRNAFEILKCVASQGTSTSFLLRSALTLLNRHSAIECLSKVVAQALQSTQEREEDEDALMELVCMMNKERDNWAAVVNSIGCLDVLGSFAYVAAAEESTCRPQFVEDAPAVLECKGIWHPYAVLGAGNHIVRNDLQLGVEFNRAMLLTGPNMGGKSTLLRATCLLTLMAQMGCYVASESCRLSIVDTIFTRIGASDRIMCGESTFMVECMEAASILKNATCDSLVVLDELGRGTSTYDGYAIAYAVFKHVVEVIKCRLMFATHYHELTDEFGGVVDVCHMACEKGKEGEGMVLLYKLCKGVCRSSFGMEVGIAAGLPISVVDSAAKHKPNHSKTHTKQQQEEWLLAAINSSSYHSLIKLWRQLRQLYNK